MSKVKPAEMGDTSTMLPVRILITKMLSKHASGWDFWSRSNLHNSW